MKKIVLSFIWVFGFLTGYSQQYPVNQFLGSPTTLVTSRGALKADSALILPAFTDTAKANISPFIKNYAGTLIRVGDSLYVRSNDVSKWILIGSGGGGATNAWLLTGNSDAIAGYNYLGTINNIPLEFRVKNIKSGIIDSTYKNTALGYASQRFSQASAGVDSAQNNTSVGFRALGANVYGDGNTALGYGANALGTNLIGNTSVGYGAGAQNRTSTYDVAIGWGAMPRDFYGSANVAVGADIANLVPPSVGDTMRYNTMMGYASAYTKKAGNNNVFIGDSTGAANVNGSRNVFIGSRAGKNETGSDKLYIANSSVTVPLIKGDFADATLIVNGKLAVGSTSKPDSTLDVKGSARILGLFPSNNASDSMMVIKTDGGVALRTAPKGTVTSVSQGFGITNSPNPITSTGTVAADTTTSGLSGKYLRITDTTNKWIGGITANNGLTANTNTNVQLGGTLNKVTTINSAGFPLNITGSVDETQLASLKIYNNYNSASGLGLYISSIGGGIVSSTTNNTSIYGSSTNGAGLYGFSNNNYAIVGSALGSTYAGSFESRYNSDFNTIQPVMKLSRASYGSTPLNGIGSALDLQTITSDGTINLSARIATKWNNVTFASRSSDIELYNVHNAIYGRKLALNSLGKLTLDKYGVGSFTGTPTYSLSVDASGNVIESSLSTGGVTSVATGYGLSGGTITSTGTLVADTTTGGLSGKYLRIVDTTNKWVNNVTKLNDTTIVVSKGGTNTNIVLPPSVVYTENPIMSRTSGDSNIIYFNADTANAWRGGSGTTPSLQEVTTAGATTTDKVTMSGGYGLVTNEFNSLDGAGEKYSVINSFSESVGSIKLNWTDNFNTSFFNPSLEMVGEGSSSQNIIRIKTDEISLQNPDKGALYMRMQNGTNEPYLYFPATNSVLGDTIATLADVRSLAGGGGTGTVTDISQGYGIVASPTNPITTSGTIDVDTTTSGLSGKYLRIVDTTDKWVNNISRTLGKDSIIFFIGSTRYAIKDSSGGQNLQQVTDKGAITSNNITVQGLTQAIQYKNNSIEFRSAASEPYIIQTLAPSQEYYGQIDTLPTRSGVLAISVNGVKADTSGNITLSTTGGGTVTSITQGYGITNSPNPIVATGTITVDTATLSGKYFRIVDTANKWVNNISRTIGKDSIIFNIGSTRYAIKDSVGTNPPASGYYGAFADTLTQTIASTTVAYPMNFRVTDLSNGVSVVNNNRVLFANAGIYNLQYSAQFTNSSTSTEVGISVWIRKNGVDVSGSNGYIQLPKKGSGLNGETLPSWNFVLSLAAGDSIVWYWRADNTAASITSFAAGTSPTRPSTASTILTVTQQSGIMAGTGITGLGTSGNAQTGATQVLATGTSGTDFAISSSSNTQTFNLPDASASNRGALTSANWTTFNNKIGAADTSVFQRKSISANTIMANNTASPANATGQTFVDKGYASYTATITYTGTAPTSAISTLYKWNQIGKQVNLFIYLNYTNAGSGITNIQLDLPSDCPTPSTWGLANAASTFYQFGGTYTAKSSTTATGNVVSANVYLRRNAANSGYEFQTSTASTAPKVLWFNLTYFVD